MIECLGQVAILRSVDRKHIKADLQRLYLGVDQLNPSLLDRLGFDELFILEQLFRNFDSDLVRVPMLIGPEAIDFDGLGDHIHHDSSKGSNIDLGCNTFFFFGTGGG